MTRNKRITPIELSRRLNIETHRLRDSTRWALYQALQATDLPLEITATGLGQRRVTRPDRYGLPRTAPGRVKRVQGFSTGDLVRLDQPAGKYAGVYVGRLAGIRADGRFDFKTARGKITAPWSRYMLLQRADGYAYA